MKNIWILTITFDTDTQLETFQANNSQRRLGRKNNPNRIQGHENLIQHVQPSLVQKRKCKVPKPMILNAGYAATIIPTDSELMNNPLTFITSFGKVRQMRKCWARDSQRQFKPQQQSQSILVLWR